MPAALVYWTLMALVHPGKYQAIARLIPRPNSAYMPVDASNGPVYFEPHVGLPAMLASNFASGREVAVRVTPKTGKPREFHARVRIDTPQEILYYEHGGILQYVLRQLLAGKPQ